MVRWKLGWGSLEETLEKEFETVLACGEKRDGSYGKEPDGDRRARKGKEEVERKTQ